MRKLNLTSPPHRRPPPTRLEMYAGYWLRYASNRVSHDSGRVLVPVLAMRADLNEKEFFGHLDPQTRAVIVSTLREIVRRHALRAGPTD